MKKILALTLPMALLSFSSVTFADNNQVWEGKIFSVMPQDNKTTVEFCNAHVPDRYETTLAKVNEAAMGDNKISIQDLKSKVQHHHGIYLRHGYSLFKGTFNGKPFTEKAEYYAQTLEKVGPTQGIWFTKHCKGFYSVAPKA